MKNKQFIVGITIGLVVGFGLGSFVRTRIIETDIYTIQIMNTVTALKINKRTGQTWVYDSFEGTWKVTPQSN